MLAKELLSVAKPILFNTEMVKAIEKGTKTTTRRISGKRNKFHSGDILYIRETWTECETVDGVPYFAFKADDENCCISSKPNFKGWKPSLFMPKEIARTILRVTNVKTEKLQDIVTGDYNTPVNINREGLILPCCNCNHANGECAEFIKNNSCGLLDEFIKLWNSTVEPKELGTYGWNANPLVDVISFEKLYYPLCVDELMKESGCSRKDCVNTPTLTFDERVELFDKKGKEKIK